MKRLLFIFMLGVCHVSLCVAQDIEVTESSSSEWEGGIGGGLTANEPTAATTSLTISCSSVELEGGARIRLFASVNADASNKTILWSSDSPAASVNSDGLVMGLKKGIAVITATAAGNTSLTKTCTVTVTSDYEGMLLPDVAFEFCYNVVDYDAVNHSIPNHPNANLSSVNLQLSENIPTLVNNELLRISDRCEGFLDKWEKGSDESGAYFYRKGEDCMTIVAKVAPKLNTNNVSDFVCNRGDGYNYMWRIGDHNSSFLHTGNAYGDDRVLPLQSDQPQVLAVRVDGKNNYIRLQNLTTGEDKRVDGVNWGGDNNVFKLFYSDGSEYFLGDFYWVYYSFELLTDAQLSLFDENVLTGDANGDRTVTILDAIITMSYLLGENPANFNLTAADVNKDGVVTVSDLACILDIIQRK